MARQIINNTDTNPDSLPVGANKINQMTQELYAPSFGLYDYNHSGASQSITANNWTQILNDGNGSDTNLTYALPNKTPYNTANSNLDFSDLLLGDSVDIRFDGIITTNTANQTVDVRLILDENGINYPLEFIRNTYKNTGTYPLFGSIRVDILNDEIFNGINKIEINTDATAVLVLKGWNIKVNKRLKG